MVEFNSDDHYIYYRGQERLRRNGVAVIVKSLKCSTWAQPQKQENDLSSFPRQTIQHHSDPSLCPNHDAREAEVERFYEDPHLFTIGDWNAKVASQEILGVTGKFGLGEQSEAGQRLTEFCQNTLVQQTCSSNNTRDDSTHGRYQMVNTEIRLIILIADKDGEAL